MSTIHKSTNSNFGTFQNEVNLIVNGVVVLNRTISNIDYLNNKDLFSQKVWYNVNFLNWLFSESTTSKMALQSIINQNPQLQNLTGSELETGILNIIKERNGFTDDEMYVIANYRYFTDDIVTYIEYPGDADKKITFEDPDSNELISLNFPGNPISRVSTMIYANGGYFHVDDHDNPTSYLYKYAGYEGVRSFAIVTTKVTDEILRYWLDQKDRTNVNGTLLYPDGPMKAAYGTFLEALLMIKAHDMVANQAAAQYNVTWSRTTPIVVSVFDDAYRTVLTLECSHRFGMDVTGDVNNITAFRYACSSAINPIEHMVGESLFPGGNSTSITIGLGQMILNGEMVDMFMSNGYLVMKSGDNSLFLVFDPETGILRDIMLSNSTFSGSSCYSDQQAEWASELGDDLLSNLPSVNLNIFNSISDASLYLSGIILGTGLVVVEEGAVVLSRFFWPITVIMAPIMFLEAVKPYALSDAESNGYYNTANWLRKNLKDQMWDVALQFMGFGNGPGSGVYDESNNYIKNNPNVQRNLQDIKNFKEFYNNFWGSVNGAINLFLPDREPTLEEVGTAFLSTVTLYLEDDFHFKQSVESKKRFEKNMKILTDNGDDGDPLKQYEKLGIALGVALLASNYSQAIQIVIMGGLCAIGESIAETLKQKEKAENLTNNTNNTGGLNGTP